MSDIDKIEAEWKRLNDGNLFGSALANAISLWAALHADYLIARARKSPKLSEDV